MRRRKKAYHIAVPVSEYWIMRVEATSFHRAQKILKGRKDLTTVTQLYSIAAPVGARAYKLIDIKEIDSED